MRAETVEAIVGLDGQIASVTAARADANSDDEHDPEGATIAFDRAQAEAVRSVEATRLDEIDAALSRIAEGTYGRCEVCGEPIAAARLDARPFTARCRRHA